MGYRTQKCSLMQNLVLTLLEKRCIILKNEQDAVQKCVHYGKNVLRTYKGDLFYGNRCIVP